MLGFPYGGCLLHLQRELVVTHPISPSKKTKKIKSPDNRSSSAQCVHLSYLYKHIRGYKHTAYTHTQAHIYNHSHTGLG